MLDSKSREAIVCTISESPIGIVTEHDLLNRVLAPGRDPRSTRIIEVMSMPIETVDENCGIGKALLKMGDLQIKRLGVTRQGRIVGLITRASLAANKASV
jgi:signal-transduction protein with cAMP-binding, CBS, and nucleotidyltransferase domain